MFDSNSGEGLANTFMRKMVRFTSVAVLIAAIYVGWVFYSRWSTERAFNRKRAEAAAERARKDYELSGGSSLKILTLNATPGVVGSGQTVQLCYGVINAKSLTFEPKVNDVWPSRSRCVEVSPRKDTTYVLTAQDESGHIETAQVKVLVR